MMTDAGMLTAQHTVVATPIGDLTVVREGHLLTGLYFPHHWYKPDPVGSSRVDLQACKLEYSIVSPK